MFGQRISSTVRSVALPSKNSLHLISRAIFGASRVVEGDYPGLALPVPLGGRNVKLAPPGAEITLTSLSAAACRVYSQRSTVLYNQLRYPLSRDRCKTMQVRTLS